MGHCIWGVPFIHGGWFPGHGPFGLLLGVILLAVIFLLLLRLGRAILGRGNADRDSSDSLEILRARFARGEISAEEYQRMREILGR